MINEIYCSYETSRLLKEKMFDELTDKCIGPDGNPYEPSERAIHIQLRNSDIKGSIEQVTCPSLAHAMKWLREVHHIHVCPEYKAFFQERPKKIYHHWCSKIVGIDRYFKRGINDVDVLDLDYFFFSTNAQAYHDSYEEACEECIKFALENLVTD